MSASIWYKKDERKTKQNKKSTSPYYVYSPSPSKSLCFPPDKFLHDVNNTHIYILKRFCIPHHFSLGEMGVPSPRKAVEIASKMTSQCLSSDEVSFSKLVTSTSTVALVSMSNAVLNPLATIWLIVGAGNWSRTAAHQAVPASSRLTVTVSESCVVETMLTIDMTGGDKSNVYRPVFSTRVGML